MWYLLNYSVLNVYLVLLLINVIDEISKTEKYNEYSLFYYIKYLNLNKDLIQIVELRSLSSVLSLYIQKALKSSNIGYRPNKIKSFAFIINNIYNNNIPFKIINFKIEIKHHKLYDWELIFQPFYVDIVALLNDYFLILSRIEYLKIKQSLKLNSFEEFILLVIKMLLYYLWDFENLNKNNINWLNLTTNDITIINELEYELTDEVILLSKIKLINKNNINFYLIHKNKEFYEQFYLYANLLSIYDKTGIIDLGNYKNLENYVEILIYNLYITSNFNGLEVDETIELEILKRLNEYKASFIEEWKNSLNKDLEIRNYQRLKDLNEYIVKNIKEK
jgi:hypothetical protein